MHGCRAELTPREGQAADSVLRMLGAIQRASREIWEPAALAASPQREDRGGGWGGLVGWKALPAKHPAPCSPWRPWGLGAHGRGAAGHSGGPGQCTAP